MPTADELAIGREFFSDLTDRELDYIIRNFTGWPNFAPSTTVSPEQSLRQQLCDLVPTRARWETQLAMAHNR